MNSTPSLVASSVPKAESTAPKFHSPLKKRPLHKLIPHDQEELKKQHLVHPPKRRRLLPVPLFSSHRIEGLDVPDKLKPTIQAIEAYTQNLGHLVTAESQAKIAAIIESQSLSLEEKEIELGLLYFYITAHKNIPQELPLFSARLEEIEGEVHLLQEEYELACLDNKEIPSGSLHYIQRAFFHMIFTEDGAFNIGGCLAVQKFLTQSRLNLLLTEEERNRMLDTVTLLLEDEEFKDLFMQPLTPHPTLKRVLSLDIKKSSKESLSATEIRWALLLQFFSLIRQTDEGNCYAVAAYLNLQSEHPKVLLNMTIELLKSGKLDFEGVEIPAYLILGNRLQWEADFNHECDPDTASMLTPLVVAQNALGIQPIPPPDNSDDSSLNTLFSHAFGASTEEAKQLFVAHKFNMVQQMMLSVLQFIAKNATAHTEGCVTAKVGLFRDLSKIYMADFKKKLERAGLDYDEEIENFFFRFEGEVNKKIYFIDLRNWTHIKREGCIIYDNHAVGLKIEGEDPEDYSFKFISRPYMHKEGHFIPIERISEFATYMAECVEGALKKNSSERIFHAASLLKSFLSSYTFQLITSEWLESTNKRVNNNLKANAYLDSDSFFLSAQGSLSYLITDFGPLYSAYAPQQTFTSTDTKDFFKNLCSHVRDIVKANPFYQKKGDHKILIRFPGHSFNLTINKFSRYWKSEDDLLDEKLIKPAQNLLAATLSEKQMERILFLFGGTRAKTAFASFLSPSMSAKEFKEEMLAQLITEKQKSFKEAFNIGLQEIPYRKFRADARSIFYSLSERQLSEEETAQVDGYFKNKHKELSYLSLHQAAKLLKKALLTLETPKFIPAYKLEQAICEFYGLPPVVHIANLNWVEQQSEHLKYKTLVVHYDLADEEIVLSERMKGREFISIHTAKIIKLNGLIPSRSPAASAENL